MKRHTEQFKLTVVEHYLGGTDGYKEVGRYHDVACSLVKRWVAFYRYHGLEGLKAKASNSPYSPEFKLSVLRHMWDNKLSYAQTAAEFNIRGQCYIGVWERSFLDGGLDALMPPPQRRDTKMPDSKIDSSLPPAAERPNDEARSREELLEELNYLRMENAYLKKLEALVQAKQQAAARTKRK
jgi:transposase